MLNRREAFLAAGATLGAVVPGLAAEPKPPEKPKTCALAGTCLDDLHLYLCAFHVAKDNAKVQVEAHHYCFELRPEVFQCIVTESNKPKARILGIEYIVSDRIYQKLAKEEKAFWHPHDYEVSSGLLVAPNLTVEEENKLMDGVKTTWGKTWHTWPDLDSDLPLGKPVLMWAFDKDGQIDPELIKKRDASLKISTPDIKKRRAK